MFEKLLKKSPFAVVVSSALEEARRRGDRRLGTEHLFLGLLQDPATVPAQVLGVDLQTARAALDTLDRTALEAIGIDVGDAPARAPRKHPPLTTNALSSGAREVITRSLQATTAKTRPTAPNHLLLALLACERPDPVAELVNRLSIDRSAVRERIDHSDL